MICSIRVMGTWWLEVSCSRRHHDVFQLTREEHWPTVSGNRSLGYDVDLVVRFDVDVNLGVDVFREQHFDELKRAHRNPSIDELRHSVAIEIQDLYGCHAVLVGEDLVW